MATTLSDLELTRQAADVDDLPADKSLVLRFQMGNPEAYDEIFARYRPLAHRICLRILGNREDAQEAVQETMLRVLRGLPVFNGRYQLQAWVARIATNVSVDMVRAGRAAPERHGHRGPLDDAGADASMDPEEIVTRILEQERVRARARGDPGAPPRGPAAPGVRGRSHEEIAGPWASPPHRRRR